MSRTISVSDRLRTYIAYVYPRVVYVYVFNTSKADFDDFCLLRTESDMVDVAMAIFESTLRVLVFFKSSIVLYETTAGQQMSILSEVKLDVKQGPLARLFWCQGNHQAVAVSRSELFWLKVDEPKSIRSQRCNITINASIKYSAIHPEVRHILQIIEFKTPSKHEMAMVMKSKYRTSSKCFRNMCLQKLTCPSVLC